MNGKNSHGNGWVLAAAVLAAGWVGAFVASAQAGEDVVPAAGGRPADVAPGPGGEGGGIPEDWLRRLTPEELEKIIRKAAESFLAEERQKVIDEIQGGALFDEAAKDAAVKVLREDPPRESTAGAGRDNIERILAAFAKADPQFGRASALLAEGKSNECAVLIKRTLNDRESGYFAAARRFLYAEALAKAAREVLRASQAPGAGVGLVLAADAYRDLANDYATALARAGRKVK